MSSRNFELNYSASCYGVNYEFHFRSSPVPDYTTSGLVVNVVHNQKDI